MIVIWKLPHKPQTFSLRTLDILNSFQSHETQSMPQTRPILSFCWQFPSFHVFELVLPKQLLFALGFVYKALIQKPFPTKQDYKETQKACFQSLQKSGRFHCEICIDGYRKTFWFFLKACQRCWSEILKYKNFSFLPVNANNRLINQSLLSSMLSSIDRKEGAKAEGRGGSLQKVV